ncbi:strictosidine synthase [Haematococcus lacustris]
MLTVYDIVKQAVVLILGIVLAVGFGPIALPLPGLPHVKIVDLKEALRAPEPLPLEGVLEPNNALEAAVVLFNNTLQSSESVLVEPDGSVVLLDKYGALLTAAPNASAPGGYQLDPVPKAWLGPSRPLGFKRDAQGDLIVCNTALGLVKVVGSSVVLLGQRVSDSSPLDPGSPILYANTLDISPTTGVVYFSDSQMIPVTPNYGVPRARPWYDTLGSYLRGVYSGQATGRVMAYFPNNGSIHVLAKGMWFSNGVALSADESFLLVAETNMFRLLKLWLKGPKAGMLELAVDRLPGFPDGVTRSHDGGFWVALPSPRNQLFQMLQYRSIRTLMAYLPASMRPPLPMWGAVIKVDADGKITRFLADMSGRHVAFIAAVDEQVLENGSIRLWLGNVAKHYIAYIDI